MQHRKWLLAFLVCLAHSIAHSQTSQGSFAAAIKVPVDCSHAAAPIPSCGEDISLSEATKSYRPKARGAKPMLLTDRCDEARVIGFYYFWVPKDEIADGEGSFDQLRSRLKTGLSKHNTVVVQGAESTPTEQHIARCKVADIKGASGPPMSCTTVAIVTSDKTWLRVAYPGNICVTAGEYRESGALDIAFEVNTPLKVDAIAASILHALEGQFGLSARQHFTNDANGSITDAYIQSATSLRDSKILNGGWREAMDFDFDLEQQPAKIKVLGTAHVMVSRQAVSQLTEYTGLSDRHRGVYLKALNDGIEQALLHASQYCRRVDYLIISCP